MDWVRGMVAPLECWMTRSWATVPVFCTVSVLPALAVMADGVILNSLRLTWPDPVAVPPLLPLLPLLPPLLLPPLLVPPLLPPHAAASIATATRMIAKPPAALLTAIFTFFIEFPLLTEKLTALRCVVRRSR